MEEEFKSPPLQKEWESRAKIMEQSAEAYKEARKLQDEVQCLKITMHKFAGKTGKIAKLEQKKWKLLEGANYYWRRGFHLFCKAERNWIRAVKMQYGLDAKIVWREWNDNNPQTCHINGDTYA